MRGKFNGAKHTTEAWAVVILGRGAFCTGRSISGSRCGLYRSENAGMSSENCVRIVMAEYLRFPGAGSSAQGKPGAKARLRSVVDAQTVEIPLPPDLK